MSTALATVDPRTTALAAVKCGYYKDLRSEEQALIKIMAGAEMGIPPIQSLSNVHIVEGRPTIGVHGVAAAIRRSGRYDYEVLESNAEVCRIVFVRLDRGPQPVRMGESVWTIEDARRAGLAGRGPWKSYAEDMLYARAMTRGARRYCPDVFGGGVYTAEELGAGGVASAEVSVEEAPRTPDRPALQTRTPEVIEAVIEAAPARVLTSQQRFAACVRIIATHVDADVVAVGKAILHRFELSHSSELDTADPTLVERLLEDTAAVSQDPERARRWWARAAKPAVAPAPAARDWKTVNGELHAIVSRMAREWEGMSEEASLREVHRITRHRAGQPDAQWAQIPAEELEITVQRLRELDRIDEAAEFEAAWSAWVDSAPT